MVNIITFPISDYPTSSDESARNQALSERKGEITQKMQDVQESNLDKSKKSAITDNLKEQTDNLSTQIRHNQVEKDYKTKLSTKQSQNQQVENKAIEKQAADSKSESLLDTRA